MSKTSLSYKPRGRWAFECVLETGTERRVIAVGGIDEDGTDAELQVSGDKALCKNDALCQSLGAYGKQEFLGRRTRHKAKKAAFTKESKRFGKLALGIAEMAIRDSSRRAIGWCSACFEETLHHSVDGWQGTSAYLCTGCGSPTSTCAAPNCPNMAVRGVDLRLVKRFCAEHRHEIPSFEKLRSRLKSLDEVADWLKFEKRNLARATRIFSLAAIGLAAISPLAFAAAPAIGGALGASAIGGNLVGAAAVSHGLAILGGGSLAAGGFGMAGGTLVITAAGGMLGASLGGVVASAYVSADKSFKVNQLRPGKGTPVILVSGFLTEKDEGWHNWRELIDHRYPENPVYRVHWGSKELMAFGKMLGQGLVGNAGAAALKPLAARAAKAAAGNLGVLGIISQLFGIAKNPWHVAKTRADMTAAVLADLLARVDTPRFILVGHSLGARVVEGATRILGTRPGRPKVQTLHLLGPAVAEGGDLQYLSKAVSGQVENYHSTNDKILGILFRTIERARAVGCVGYKSGFKNIVDRDVSRRVKSHHDYVKKIRLHAPSAKQTTPAKKQ